MRIEFCDFFLGRRLVIINAMVGFTDTSEYNLTFSGTEEEEAIWNLLKANKFDFFL